MPKWLIMSLFLAGCVAWTGLLAAGGSGWRAGLSAIRFFGGWMIAMVAAGFIVWLLA